MRKTKSLVILIAAVLLLASCTHEIPNPIIGTYSLKAEGSTYDSAAVCLNKDGSFVFEQIIPGTSQTVRLEGTYTYSLRAFNFTSADGSITLKVTTPLPTGVQNTFLKVGSNYFLYDWKCDKDSGPVSLTLVTNANDINSIYEFVYSATEASL